MTVHMGWALAAGQATLAVISVTRVDLMGPGCHYLVTTQVHERHGVRARRLRGARLSAPAA